MDSTNVVEQQAARLSRKTITTFRQSSAPSPDRTAKSRYSTKTPYSGTHVYRAYDGENTSQYHSFSLSCPWCLEYVSLVDHERF